MLKKINIKLKKNFIWRIKSLYHLWLIYSLFDRIEKNIYVLVKEHYRFPFIKYGSDFDIYTIEIEKFTEYFTNFYEKKIKYNLTFNYKKPGNLQLDLFHKNNFIYKFDIYSVEYKSVNHNKNFLPEVVKSRLTKNFFFFRKFQIEIPNPIMDSLIRIFELHTFPNKLHHSKKLRSQSNEIILQAEKDVTKYSDISYKNIFEKINSA